MKVQALTMTFELGRIEIEINFYNSWRSIGSLQGLYGRH